MRKVLFLINGAFPAVASLLLGCGLQNAQISIAAPASAISMPGIGDAAQNAAPHPPTLETRPGELGRDEDLPRGTLAAAAPNDRATAERGAAREIRAPDAAEEANYVQSQAYRVFYVRTVAGLCASWLCLVIPLWSWRRKHAAKMQLKKLNWGNANDPVARSRILPRILPNNPFSEITSLVPLPRQMEVAARASLEFGRTLGVVYFNLDGTGGRNRNTLQKWSDDEIANLLSQFRRTLRSTDHVTVINDVEIIVCISLLSGLSDLKKIAQRLQNVGHAMSCFGRTFEAPGALSIYPMCGYSGDDLIEFVRARFRSAEHGTKLVRPPRGVSSVKRLAFRGDAGETVAS